MDFDVSTACEGGDNSFRTHGLVAVDTVNGNAGATMLMFLEKSAADAVVGQELRVAGAQALTLLLCRGLPRGPDGHCPVLMLKLLRLSP